MTFQATSSMAPWSPVAPQRTPWHSPVQYLFGGLAVMFGLIAFALFILCFSCWQASRDRETNPESGNRIGNRDFKPVNHKKPHGFEEKKYLVIMAGQVNPTFLATPVSSRSSSFGSCSCMNNSTVSTDFSDKEKGESSDQLQVRNTENHEASHQTPNNIV